MPRAYEPNVLGSATNATHNAASAASYSKAQETCSELARRNLMQSRGQGGAGVGRHSLKALKPQRLPLYSTSQPLQMRKGSGLAIHPAQTQRSSSAPPAALGRISCESFCSTPRIKIAQAYRSCETASPATRSPVSSLNLMACKSLVGQRGPRQLGGTDLLPADDPGDVLARRSRRPRPGDRSTPGECIRSRPGLIARPRGADPGCVESPRAARGTGSDCALARRSAAPHDLPLKPFDVNLNVGWHQSGGAAPGR